MLVLVIYDVPDNRRRQKLANFLEGHGRRVQKSAFECFLSLEEMQKLYQQVQKRVKATEDDVRFYWIPSDAVGRSLKLGWQWFLLPIGQIVWVLICLGIVQVAMFGVFILSLGHLMQQPFPFVISGLHLIGIAAYHLIIVAHSTLPVLALCWRSPLSMPQRSGFA